MTWERILDGAFNVRHFGAAGNGTTDDTNAINAAITSVPPAGGTVAFPAGVYLVSSGITITDKHVDLIGEGGTGQIVTSNAVNIDAKTIIKAQKGIGFNQPILKYSVGIRLPSPLYLARFQQIKNIALMGSGEVASNQHGLHVDNGGLNCTDIMLVNCGGHGLYITDALTSVFVNVKCGNNKLDGVNMDYSVYMPPNTPTQVGAVTTCWFLGFQAVGNGRDGIRIANAWGNTFHGGLVEGNSGFGIRMQGDNPGSVGNRFYGVWDEANGSTLAFEPGSTHNFVDYVRWASGAIVSDQGIANNWQGVDISGSRLDPPFLSRLHSVRAHSFGTLDATDPPSASPGAAAGVGATASVGDPGNATAKDAGGIVALTTGAKPSVDGILVTVTFLRSYAKAPVILLVPANAESAAAQAKAFVPAPGDANGPTAKAFNVVAAGSALKGKTVYKWTWLALEVFPK